MKETLEETIKELALDIQEGIKNGGIAWSGDIAAKTNALANLVRAFVEVPNDSKGAVSSSSIEVTASEVKFSVTGGAKRNRIKIVPNDNYCDAKAIMEETRRMLRRLRQTTGNKSRYEVTISLLQDKNNSQEVQMNL